MKIIDALYTLKIALATNEVSPNLYEVVHVSGRHYVVKIDHDANTSNITPTDEDFIALLRYPEKTNLDFYASICNLLLPLESAWNIE